MPMQKRRAARFNLTGFIRTLLCALLLLGTANAAPWDPHPYTLPEGDFVTGVAPWIERLPQSPGPDTPALLLRPDVANHFQLNNKPLLNLGYVEDTIWLRLALENTANEPRPLILHLSQPSLGSVELFYLADTDTWHMQRAGIQLDRQYADYKTPGYTWDIAIPANTSRQILLRLQSAHAISTNIVVATPAAFLDYQQRKHLSRGITLGLALAVVIFAFLRQLQTSERTYLYASLCAASAVVYIGAFEGYLGQWLFAARGTQNALESFTAAMTIGFALLFSTHFLETREMLPRLHNGLKSVALLAGTVPAFLIAGEYTLATQLVQTSMLATAILILIASITALRNGRSEMRDFLLGIGCAGISATLISLQLLGAVTLPIATFPLILAGTLGSALFSLIAIHKYTEAKLAERTKREVGYEVNHVMALSQSEMLSRFSHEARSPLNGIMGMSELLQGTTLSSTQKKYLNVLQGSAGQLLMLLNRLVEFARLQSGRFELKVAPFDPHIVLGECISLLSAQAESQKTEIICLIDDNVGRMVLGDEARIHLVLSNLLGNAVEHTDGGEIHITIKRGESPSDTVNFCISDTGTGISEARLKEILQHDRLMSETIGLSIVKRTLDAMHSQLNGQSTPGAGSSFSFELSLPIAQAEIPSDDAPLGGLHMLVVDDNPSVTRLIEQFGIAWGMQVQTANNGREALAMLRTQETLGNPFDVIILDYLMPGMNGLQTAARIREDALLKSRHLVIMLTGVTNAPSTSMAQGVGIDRILSKPVSARALRQLIADELQRGRQLPTTEDPQSRTD